MDSPFGGSEIINPGQVGTVNGHAGNTMTFTITEQGYGYTPVAKYNGVQLPDGPVTTITDSRGIVTGFTRQFTYSGSYVSGGTFTYQNTPSNSSTPLSTFLNVTPYYTPAFRGTDQAFFSSDYLSSTRPTPIAFQYQATDPNGGITYRLETANGLALTSNVSITSYGYFTWDGAFSSMFTRSTSCPYPYYAQLWVVATDSRGAVSRLLVTLQVHYGPLPNCAPPPPGPGSN